ncbi:hypothetical protein H311_02235 [Anncaliia algerae PRA109]|nr:hypothetical protein H311_02235 [Anncaliia algerae PRA109]
MNETKIDIKIKEYTIPSFKRQNTSEIIVEEQEVQELMNLSYETNEIKIDSIDQLDCTWRKVLKIKFSKSLTYVPGDSLGIITPNSKEFVLQFMEFCGFTNKFVKIKKKRRFNYEGSLFNFFYKYFDFRVLPKKAFFYFLSKECNNPLLEYLSSNEGEDDYFNILRNNMNLYDLLTYFDVKPSLDLVIEYSELIKPRYFSLINPSGKSSEIIVGLIENGHSSDFFYKAKEKFDDYVFPFLIKENRLLRLQSDKPILCIATGTGVTPFISFSNENKYIWLVYGCRNKEDDISIYGNFLEKDIAYSSKNIRISNILEEKKEKVKEYILNYQVYICASTTVQKSIYEYLKNNFGDHLLRNKVFFDDWS